MPDWLSRDYAGSPFMLFGAGHLITLTLIFIGCLLLAWFCRGPAANSPHKAALRYALATLLLITHIAWDGWQIVAGVWTIDWSLPLHICQLAQLLSVVMLLTHSQCLFDVLYFWGMVGATQALLTPNLSMHGFPHIAFLAYFLSHGGTLLSITYMLAAEGYRPGWSSLWRSWLALHLLLPLIILVNLATGGNYWFLAHPPVTPSLIDYLGPWPWYILVVEVIALGLFVLALLPFVWNRTTQATHRMPQ